MKYSEFHRLIKKQGWRELYQDGTSHIIYEKDGVKVPVPFHGAKEIGKGLVQKIKKQMGLK